MATRRIRNGLTALAQLGWSRVERALAVLCVLAGFQLWVLAGAGLALARPDRAQLLQVAVVEAALPVLAALLAGSLLLVLAGLVLRRRRPDALGFQYLCAFYYACTLLWLSYLVGSLSLPAGVVHMGSVLTGYVLFERVVVRISFLLSACGLLALSLASALGVLPYAAALVSPQASGDALLWTHACFFLATPHLLICLVATALMLGRWQRRENQILRLSLTDALTGVHNRRSILAQLEAERARAREQSRPLAVALLDLDHFKRINDSWGHAVGDRVLREAAATLQACLRPGDALGRFGGEEFLLLLPDIAAAEAAVLLERCRAALAALDLHCDAGERVPVSASFGVAWCADSLATTTEALVQAADGRLYAAKQGGRNQVQTITLTATSGDAAATARVVRESGLPRRRLRFQHLLRSFLRGWQRWSPVDKQMCQLALTIGLFGHFMVWAAWMKLRVDRDMLVNLAWYTPLMGLMTGIVTGLALLIVVGALIRRRWPDSRLYQVVSQQFFGLSLIAVGQVIGMLGFPTGIMLVSMPLMGFIYFERRLVWWSLSTPLLLVVALAYASALGHVPYAPALAAGVDRYQPHSLFWVLSFYHFTWTTMAVVVLLADQTMGRWRQRGEELRTLSRTDALTRVLNRRSIFTLLEREVARAQQKGRPPAVVLLDLDHFKRINDSWGHPTGDRVLQEAARLLAATLRTGDAIGRYGGEEFLLLLPATSLDGAAALAERCRAELARVTVTADNGEVFSISASFGVVGNAPALDSDALVRAADHALYRAKAAGRNRVEAAASAA